MRFDLSRFFALFLVLASPAGAADFETKAATAYMVDAGSGSVLFAKDADAAMQPASLAKLMTMEVVFARLRAGELSLDQTFPVSEHAWRTGGAPSGTSTMFAALKSTVSLRDLIQGVIVQGANDGCLIIAEGVAGSDEAFAKLMNERAGAIGLTGSRFLNSTGLPAEGQTTTARDLVRLAEHIWRTYPEFYAIYAQPEFTWNKITQRNRNPLLRLEIGADGMGTGYTEASGFAIVGSAARDGRRVFMAMGGLKSDKERAEQAKAMLDWAAGAFTETELFAAGEIVGSASVYGGSVSAVSLEAAGPIRLLLPADNEDRVQGRIVYAGPVAAPVEAGAAIGALRVTVGDRVALEVPLRAAHGVGQGSLAQRAVDAVGELLVGWLR